MADHFPNDNHDDFDEDTSGIVAVDDQIDEIEDATAGPDVDDDALEDDGADDVTSDGAGSAGSARAKRAQNARLARRAIAKFLELSAAPAEQLSMLAAATGGKTDPTELAVAVATGPRVNLGAIDHLVALSELVADDPLEAMFAALGLDRDQAKQAWALLSAAGAATGPLPAKDRDAAKALTRAVAQLSKSELATFDAVRALSRK